MSNNDKTSKKKQTEAVKELIEKELKFYNDNYTKILESKYSIPIMLIYLLHIAVTFWQPYVVITLIFGYKNKFYDKLVIGVLLAIAVHWVCLKNECIISLIEKKMMNKDYETGSYPSLHPGLFYFMHNYMSFNLYDYGSSSDKKLLTIVNTYIFPQIAVFYLMYRNNFFGNYELCVLLCVMYFIVMVYQVKNDKVLNNLD